MALTTLRLQTFTRGQVTDTATVIQGVTNLVIENVTYNEDDIGQWGTILYVFNGALVDAKRTVFFAKNLYSKREFVNYPAGQTTNFQYGFYCPKNFRYPTVNVRLYAIQ